MPKNEIKTNRGRVQIHFNDSTRTKQEYAQEADINYIVKKYQMTGELPRTPRTPLYADVSNVPDYQTLLNTINQVRDLFMTYPAEIRAKFNNDPAIMLDYIEKPENRDTAVQLGLLPGAPTEDLTKDQKNDKISAVSGSSEAVTPEVSKKP